MNFDFQSFLVFASIITGGIWLFDALFYAPRRRRLANSTIESAMGGAESVIIKEPILIEYARSFFPVIFSVLILRSFIIEPFRIPSNSMMPTLLTGDFILVNKFTYGLRWPILNYKFFNINTPQRGDVIVFRYPQNEQLDYIKRVIGLPGDEITYHDKTIYINGEPVAKLPVGEYTGVGSGIEMSGAREELEDLKGVKHEILIRQNAPDLPFGCRVLAFGPIQIQPGQYFVMGDNRDNSNDSRCWGFVPEQNLVGKAITIWMHWDSKRSGLPIAWNRLGTLIH